MIAGRDHAHHFVRFGPWKISTVRDADVAQLRERQMHDEARALAELARHGDRPAVILDDAIADGEAEAGALPDLLRREEGIEDLR